MELFKGLAGLIPGGRHILAGWPLAGVGWFAAFILPLNFGILAPIAWPGPATRVLRAILVGAAVLVAWAAHRRVEWAERLSRRLAARRRLKSGSVEGGAGPSARSPSW
jgi:hypothetical protein